MELWQLQQKQSLPLEAKIAMTQQRICEWYEHWDGEVYVSFSGGKDSTVLLHIVRQMYPDVPAVFSDTGLEFPEIREFVKSTPNVTWIRPDITFRKVIEKCGYPVIGKEQANGLNESSAATLLKCWRRFTAFGATAEPAAFIYPSNGSICWALPSRSVRAAVTK